jgi:hypothetical protein
MGYPRDKNDFMQERLALHMESYSAFRALATCTITVDTNANMADGDTITIDDGYKKIKYEYDKSANGVAAGNVSWAAGAGTAAQSATTLATAINATQSCLTVTDNGDGTLTLTHKQPDAGNPAGNTKSSSSTLAITAWAGGSGQQGITATQTVKRWKTSSSRTFVMDRVFLNMPAGFVANASSYWTIAVKDGSNVIASWSTQTTNGSPGGQGTLTADTPVDLVLNTDTSKLVVAAGDILTVVVTKTGTPAACPLFTLTADGRYC